MHVLAFLFFIIFGGRLIRSLFRFFGRSLQDQDRDAQYRDDQQSRNDRQTQQSAEEAQEAYRRWQEEIYRRYRESQNQYQNQSRYQNSSAIMDLSRNDSESLLQPMKTVQGNLPCFS